MPDRDRTFDQTVREFASLLADVIARRLTRDSSSLPVDLPETESVHVIAGERHGQ